MNLVSVSLSGGVLRVVDPSTYPYATSTFDEWEPILEPWCSFGAGHTVVDVGAGFGAYTLRAVQSGARVIAIEPSLDGWRILNENLRQNFEPGSWSLHKAVAWDYTTYPSELSETVLTHDYPTALGTLRRVKLDELLANEARVHAIKIDVEGAELGVLRGAAATVVKHRPTILLEDHQEAADDHPICNYCRKVESRQNITRMLESLNYRLTWIPMEPRRMYMIAEAT